MSYTFFRPLAIRNNYLKEKKSPGNNFPVSKRIQRGIKIPTKI